MSTATSHTSKARDLETLLEFINPDTRYFTCVGYAPSQRRRCRNPIACHNRQAAYAILHRLPDLYDNEAGLRAKLRELAGLVLCRRFYPGQTSHQDQASDIVGIWYSDIVRESQTQTKSTPEPNDEDAERLRAEERRQEEECCQEEARREEEEARRQEEERRREEAARQEEARREREREETRRRREEARADRERQQRERIAREWSESWTRYERDWENMQRRGIDTLDKAVKDSVPWPVKSGRWQDVNEANVRAFLRHAPDDASENPRRFRSLLRRQSLRWHMDILPNRFPMVTDDEECRPLATLIQPVINGLKETLPSL